MLAIPPIHKLNQLQAMPIVWWSLLVAILPFGFSLFRIPIVWRVGLLFIVINCIISYHVGRLIITLKLPRYWLLMLPVVFCLTIIIKFAKYNLLFGIIYLIFEIFGLMDKQIYN
ncbi:hypothetical protein PT281_01480 [Lactobacillus sp. ESL0701]|uniref:hypothetical protein n=1 Tax=Lactobacillus sp. ESL0701 TaxID=2983217 RepID=UPI0023F8CC3D|nr:hypothetical protein [Lactobacillus sp. ESL0701]